MTEQAPKARPPSAKARKLSARLSAVQAVYQLLYNKKPIKTVAQEYADHRFDMEVDGEKPAVPDPALFKTVLFGVDERQIELEAIVMAHYAHGKEGEKGNIEPLLKAILLCGAYELLSSQDIDPPIIINDYLNVTHAFYEQGAVKLVNGILDAIAMAVR